MNFERRLEIFNPKTISGFLKDEMPNANWNSIGLNVLIVAIVITIFSIGNMFLNTITGMANYGGGGGGPVTGGALGMASIGITIISVLFGVGITIAIFAIGAGMLHVIATSLFKAKGTFVNIAYLLSVVWIPIIVVNEILNLLMIIPLVKCIVAMLSFALLIYQQYINFEIVKAAYKTDKDTAAKTVVVDVVIWIIITIIIVTILALTLGPMLGSLVKGLGGSQGTPGFPLPGG